MADEQDNSQKTEEPTSRRLEEAYKKGQVPTSKEVGNFIMLLVLTLFVMSVMPWVAERSGLFLAKYITAPDQIDADGGNLMRNITGLLVNVGGLTSLILIFSLIAAMFANFSQHGMNISSEPLMPKLNKISPIAGFGRLFSRRSFVEFLKGIIKITVIGFIAFKLLEPYAAGIDMLPSYDLSDMMQFLKLICMRLLMWSCVFLFVLAAADLLYQRYEFTKSLMMSRQELKEEFKETQGDPHIKARIKQIRAKRAKKRMLTNVPKADVVITNPEHYAVALQYDDKKQGSAPIVVAKGQDLIALKIREIAAENNVPIVQNPPLARALYASAELEEEIPYEHYKAVAEVISYVMRMRAPKVATSRF